MNVENVQTEGVSSIRRQLCLISDQARDCRRQLGSIPKQNRRDRGEVDDVLKTVIELCEFGQRASAEEAVDVLEMVVELTLNISL